MSEEKRTEELLEETLPQQDEEEVLSGFLAEDPNSTFRKKSGKNRQVKSLVIAGVVVLVLIATLLVLLFVPMGPEDGSGSSASSETISSDTSIVLIDKEQKDLNQVEVKNEKDEYTVLRVEDQSTSSTPSFHWMIDDLKDFDADTYAYNYLVSAVCDFSAIKKVVDSAENLADFGLDQPSATVKATFADGTVHTITVGGQNVDQSGYYLQMDGEDTVYLAEIDDSFFTARTAYLNTTLLATKYDSEGNAVTPDWARVTLDGSVREKPIVIEDNPNYNADNTSSNPTDALKNPYIMTSHNNYEVDATTGEFLTSLFTLSATDVVAIRPNDADLEKYGLKNHYSGIKVEAAGDSYRIRFSKPADGKCYAIMDGTDLVYEVNASAVPYLEKQYSDIITKLMFLPYIDTVESVTVQSAEGTFTFLLTGEDDTLAVSCNGTAIENVSNFRKLYQVIVGTVRYELGDKVYTGDPMLTVTFKYRKSADKPDDVLTFIPATALRAQIKLNGVGEFFVKTEQVNKIISDTQKVINGEAVIS